MAKPPSSRNLDLLVVAVFAALGALAALKTAQDVDHDLFWQLEDGKQVVELHRFPTVEEYSFTEAGKPLPATEWLAESISYVIFSRAGCGGLIAFSAAQFLAVFFLIFLVARRRLPVPESLGLVALLGFCLVNFYGARAQNWTFLFTAFYLHAAGRWEDGDARAPWAMAAAALPWANMHGGFMLGLFIFALFALRARSWAPLLLAVGLCCVHPNGIHSLTYPIWFMASPPPGRALIKEWTPVDFNEITAAPYLFLFALLFWTAFSEGLEKDVWTVLTVVLAVLALRGRKLLPEFSMAALVPLAGMRKGLVAAGAGALAALTAVVATNPRTAGLDMERYFPRAAAELVASRHPGARIFHDYEWGGYLIWKLYPAARVFIDGRLDPYWDLLPGDYATIIGARPGWRELLERYGITTALLRPTDPLAAALSAAPGWSQEYKDDRSVLFAR